MVKNFLDKLPLSLLGPVAIVLALVPIQPEPHLWQKLNMLLAGTLSQPIDIFDLLMHGTPLALLVTKLTWMGLDRWQAKRKSTLE